MTGDHIRTLEETQAEIMNNKLNRVKHDDHQDIAKKTVSSAKNQSDHDGTGECRKNAIENERYELAEARNAVQCIENTVKRAKHIVDQNSAKPKGYDKWTYKEQYEHIVNNVKTYVPSIPDSLIFLTPGVLRRGDCGRNSTDKPVWLDMEKFQRGQKFARDYNFSILIANMLSLFEIFTFTDGIKPLIFSQRSHTPYLAFKRYLSTACRVRNWMTEDPWTVGTRAYNDIQTVRRMHRAVRSKLCERDDEEIDMATKIQNPWCPDTETILEDTLSCPHPIVKNEWNSIFKPKGLNQAEMAVTQFSFMGTFLLYPREFGVCANDEDMAAFCHTWRGIGYLVGIEDQYNFCRGSLEEIKQRSRDFLEIWVKSNLRQVTPEWEHMLRCLTEGTIYFGNIFTFKVLLLYLTELLNIDMPRTRSMLTYSERFKLMFLRFLFRYVIRLRFVRDFINKIVNIKLDEAVRYGREKHKELEKRSQKILDKGR